MPKPLARGWKVIKKATRDSIFISGPGRVTYLPHRRARPEPDCGPLCVFANKTSAKAFGCQWSLAKIVPCRYKPSKHKEVWWRPGLDDVTPLRSLPPGTALADFVTCLE